MRHILALVLRAILILCAAFAWALSLWIAPTRMRSLASLIGLNFTGERDFSEAKHRLDLRGFKFKGDKIS